MRVATLATMVPVLLGMCGFALGGVDHVQPAGAAAYDYHGGSLLSHYTLCDNGTFELGFESSRFPPFDYIGKYSQSDSAVAFNFVDSDLAGPWTATATLRGDRMIVVYNEISRHRFRRLGNRLVGQRPLSIQAVPTAAWTDG
jgi:hypothetical protein